MGTIRLLLALAVVIGHSTAVFGFTPIIPRGAVQVFYIISGFYMSLVLSEKYLTGSSLQFYKNRFLRIYPVYFLVITITLIFFLFTHKFYYFNYMQYLESFKNMSFITILVLVMTNLLIIGQDWLIPTAISPENGNLYFAPIFRIENLPTQRFFILPQSWSISLELTFYLMAPYINKLSSKNILFIILTSVFLRLYFASNGFYYDPWNYRFFPFEIAYFLVGFLAYRLYKSKNELFNNKKISKYIFIFNIFFLLSFRYLSVNEEVLSFIYSFIFLMSLPYIFDLSKSWSFDKSIGELSYSLYLIHYFWIGVLEYFNKMNGISVVILSLISSYLIHQIVEKSIEKFRI